MGSYLLILPVASLVAYSQLMVKWRATSLPIATSLTGKLVTMFADPLILSAYAAALAASVAWLLVVTKLPLTIAFPVYIGVTFVMVVLGGHLMLGEPLPFARLAALVLIVAGIALGMSSNT
ncbi:hypothetical protein AB1286_06300 [Trinickia sp. NRRL B-1857]|uniref:hypothetical protein n=1 Tax=Trinickia sp. NRRL B-1857 TaxID=3162879 RepID=UPI003D2B85BC